MINNNLYTHHNVVFINSDTHNCGGGFEFHNCVKSGGLARSDGAPEYEKCFGNCCGKTLARISEQRGDWTLGLSGFLPSGMASVLRDAYESECEIKVRLNETRCGARRDINNFAAGLMISCAVVTDYKTSDLGTLSPTGVSQVTEDVTLSFGHLSEMYHMNYGFISAFDGDVLGAIFCSDHECNECKRCCQDIYLVTDSINGLRLWWSKTAGETWSDRDIVDNAYDDVWLLCVNNELWVVGSNNALTDIFVMPLSNVGEDRTVWQHIVSSSDITSVTDVVVGDFYVYAVGAEGIAQFDTVAPYASSISDPGFNMIVLAVDGDTLFAGGDTGSVHVSNSDGRWARLDTPTTNRVRALGVCDGQLWVGIDAGDVYSTCDLGCNWIHRADFGDVIENIQFDCHCQNGYISTAECLFRSYDCGDTWVPQPDNNSEWPTDEDIRTLAVCQCDGNKVVLATQSGIINSGF